MSTVSSGRSATPRVASCCSLRPPSARSPSTTRFRTIELVGREARPVRTGSRATSSGSSSTICRCAPTPRSSWDRSTGIDPGARLPPRADGPGSSLVRAVATGTECQLFGPQRSVRLDQLDAAPIIVGDETSFGLLLAWHTQSPETAPCRRTLRGHRPCRRPRRTRCPRRSGRDASSTRTPGDGHLPELEQLVVDTVRANRDAPLCLTGRAQTIAAVRRRLKTSRTPPSRPRSRPTGTATARAWTSRSQSSRGGGISPKNPVTRRMRSPSSSTMSTPAMATVPSAPTSSQP